MKHREGIFRGVCDTRIYYQSWLPEDSPEAVLLIIHGLAEHSGRYENIVQYFVPRGLAVYGIDHIGHGKSSGTRGFIKRFDDFIHTLKIYFDMVFDWQPGIPSFLVGHSLGGLIGLTYLIDHQPNLTGAVVSGPGVKVPDTISSLTIFSGNVLSFLMPRFRLIGLAAEGISRDPAVVRAYLNDPLVYTGRITARLAAEVLKAMNRITVKAARIILPIMILQGGADRLVDPAGARMLYEKVGAPDKTIKIYDGLYHEVFNEPEHDQVLADVGAWIEAHL